MSKVTEKCAKMKVSSEDVKTFEALKSSNYNPFILSKGAKVHKWVLNTKTETGEPVVPVVVCMKPGSPFFEHRGIIPHQKDNGDRSTIVSWLSGKESRESLDTLRVVGYHMPGLFLATSGRDWTFADFYREEPKVDLTKISREKRQKEADERVARARRVYAEQQEQEKIERVVAFSKRRKEAAKRMKEQGKTFVLKKKVGKVSKKKIVTVKTSRNAVYKLRLAKRAKQRKM